MRAAKSSVCARQKLSGTTGWCGEVNKVINNIDYKINRMLGTYAYIGSNICIKEIICRYVHIHINMCVVDPTQLFIRHLSPAFLFPRVVSLLFTNTKIKSKKGLSSSVTEHFILLQPLVPRPSSIKALLYHLKCKI